MTIALMYTFISYRSIQAPNFIFSGDQYFPFGLYELNKAFLSINISKDLGLIDGYGAVLNFWDSIFYKIFYTVSEKFILAAKINIFFYTYICLFTSYVGFKKWHEYLYFNKSNLAIYVAIFYTFSPYTLQLSHGGVFNITIALTYGLAPLALYLINELLNKKLIKNIDYIKIAFILTIQTFQFWLFFTYVLIIMFYCIFNIIRCDDKLLVLKRLIILCLLYVAMTLLVSYPVVFQFLNNKYTINSIFSPVFGNMQGGIWYQMKMLHSWGIYTVWEPRSMYSFGSYFFSDRYNFAIILLWSTLIIGMSKILIDERNKTSLITDNKFFNIKIKSPIYPICKIENNNIAIYLLIILLISLFFSKGAQKPFGFIFLWLYENFSLFKIFRTPDIRFGFNIIFIISLLLLIINKKISEQYIKFLIVIFLSICSWPHFNGAALKGENVVGRYYDRISFIPQDYQTAANFINKNSENYVYIVPDKDYAVFKIDHDLFVGQDMFGKLLNSPVYYGGADSSINKYTYENFNQISRNVNTILKFPISYIVFRNDILDKNKVEEFAIKNISKLVFSNNTFRIYKVNNSPKLIDAESIKIDTNLYRLSVEKKLVGVDYLNSFDEHWLLIKSDDLKKCTLSIDWFCNNYLKFNIILFMLKNDLSNFRPKITESYAMHWDVGSGNYYLFYYPQLIFDILFLLFCTMFFSLIIYFLKNAKRYL